MNHNHRVYYAFLVILTVLFAFVVTGNKGKGSGHTGNVIEGSDTHINNPKQYYSEIKRMNMMFEKNTEDAKAKYNDVKKKQYEWNMMNHGIHGRGMASQGEKMNLNMLQLQHRKAFESERADIF